jgi:ankyrin repeat protein
MYAARYSNTDSTERTVELLLEHGDDLNLQNKFGYSALMYAAENSNTDSTERTVELLLKHGANINDFLNIKCDLSIYIDYGLNLLKIKPDTKNYSEIVLPRLLYMTRMKGQIAGELPYKLNDIKFKEGSMGSKIVKAAYANRQLDVDEWMESLGDIVDYLGIIDYEDAVNKINQYLE